LCANIDGEVGAAVGERLGGLDGWGGVGAGGLGGIEFGGFTGYGVKCSEVRVPIE
jgi:hypothetical protein